ncbi:MAG: acyl-CoA thioesterase [Planctomycetes bacterium]|nr:acyl-CoA thioesterase [Planctomycetota bacterium]
MADRDPAIRVILLPRDTNEHGTIFGGVILSQIDLAGAMEIRKVSSKRFVTVAMKEVVFKEPVFVGDIVSFYTRTERIGTTSITVRVDVEAQRRREPEQFVKVTEAVVVYVAVDDKGRPVPVRDPKHTLRRRKTTG